MNGFADTAFSAILAWNQVGMLVIALVFMGIGGVIIAWYIYLHVTGIRVNGRIVSVRATGIVPKTADAGAAADIPAPPDPALRPARESFGKVFRKNPIAGIFALFFIAMIFALPLAFVGIGAWTAGDYLMLAAKGIETQGQVLRNEERRGSKGGVSYYAVVSFQDDRGTARQVTDRVAFFSRPSFSDGSSVAVHYDPANPAHALIGSASHNVALPAIFCGVGSLILFAMFHQSRRRASGSNKLKGAFSGEMYYPVYEYTDGNGAAVQAPSDSGSNWIGDKLPGTELTLFVRPDDPQSVATGSALWVLFGLLFFLPGAALLFYALSHMKFNIFVLGILAYLLGHGAWKLKKIIKPRDQRETGKQFMARKRTERAAAGTPLSEQDIRDRLRVQERNSGSAMPILVVAAVLLVAGGAYVGHNLAQLESSGSRAQGKVARLDSVSQTHGGYTYYAVVDFTRGDGAQQEFRDSTGSSSPLEERGEAVGVLYDPADPAHAIIDRGLWNWAVPAGLSGAGLLLLLLSIKIHMGMIRRRAWLDA